MLQQCSHPNVVRYLGSYQGEEYLWVRRQEWFWLLVHRKEIFIGYFVFWVLKSLGYLYFHVLADSDGILWRWKCC